MSQSYTIYSQELNSSMLKHAEYNPNEMELTITFHNNVKYVYLDIEENIVQNFFSAESHGKYFNENIKNHYNFSKL